MPKVILISGKAQSGKDTFASLFKDIASKENKSVIILRYADILKFICKEYFDWNGEKDKKGRTLLQQVGTDLFRKNNADTWVNCIIEIVKGLGDKYDYVLVPDTRFVNEIERWKKSGICYKTVRIKRLNKEGAEYDNGLSDEQKMHESETNLDNYEFDYVIENKDIEEFKVVTEMVYKDIGRDKGSGKVYVCSPLRGDIDNNIRRAKDYCRKVVLDTGKMPIAPHIYFTSFLNDFDEGEREKGIEFGLKLLEECEEVWVFSENGISSGMQGEIDRARELGIPVVYVV